MTASNPLYDAIQGDAAGARGRVKNIDTGGKFKPHEATALVNLIPRVGVRGRDAERYVALTFRYLLGKGGGGAPPTSLRGRAAPTGESLDDWIRARCWQVLEDAAGTVPIPPLDYNRQPRNAA